MCVIPIFPEHLCIYMSIDTAKDSVLTIIIIYNDTWWNHKVVFPNAVQISSGLFDVWTDRKLNSNILSIRMIMYIFFVFVDDLHIGLATIVFSWNLSLQSIFFLYINIKIESKISELRPWVKSQITKGFRPKRWRWSLMFATWILILAHMSETECMRPDPRVFVGVEPTCPLHSD